MVKQLSSAYQQIRAGNINVSEAIELLIVDGELNYQFLDKKLINSVNKITLRQAIPLVPS